jgi:hypothetical protein
MVEGIAAQDGPNIKIGAGRTSSRTASSRPASFPAAADASGKNNVKRIYSMDFGKFHFGRIEIDGVTYERDVVIDRGTIRKRKKKPSKRFREEFGHTPLSVEEEIPWNCQRLVVGTGRYGSLPVMDEVKLEARRRKVALLILPTDEAIETLAHQPKRTNAILHVTC